MGGREACVHICVAARSAGETLLEIQAEINITTKQGWVIHFCQAS